MNHEVKKNYAPGAISFSDGILTGRVRSEIAAAAGRSSMEVDAAKARKIVEGLLATRSIERAELGLDGDWDCNSCVIWDGEFHDYDAYHGSMWATPTLIVYFHDGPNEAYECWKPEEAKRVE